MKKIIFAAALVLLIATGIVTLLWTQSMNSNISDSDKAIEAITKEFPNFSSEQGPTIAIESIQQYEDGWYIATIKPHRPVEEFVPVKVLLYAIDEDGGNFKVMLGPDVYFSKRETLAFDLPDSVIIDLEQQ